MGIHRGIHRGIPWYSSVCYHMVMKIGVSISKDLVTFADEEAKRRGLSRSGLLAQLLEREKVSAQTRRYIDQHGWDVTEDEETWRSHQKRRMAEEYSDDQW